MLQSMRHLAQSWIFKGLMFLLVISFGIWGIGDMFRGNPLQRTVAKAGKVSITVQELNREFDQTLARARQMFGPGLTAEQARQFGMLDKALDGLIDRILLDQDMHDLGINVSEKTMLQQIASQQQFRDKDGKFNRELFERLLGNAQQSQPDFMAQARGDMARMQVTGLFSDSATPPAAVIDALYNARARKRILDVVTVKNDGIKGIPEPDDKTLRDFYNADPKPFTAPEYRAITVATLATDDLAKDITVTDDQVQKEYDAKAGQMKQPERRDIIQAVMQDEDKAKQLADAAKGGDLTTAAKARGVEAVPLDKTDQSSLLPELGKPAFALQPGEVSAPIKTALGWHVLQVKKIYPAGTPALADIKDDLRDSMKRDQAIESASRITNQLDDELAANHPLEDIADSLKLRLVKIPAVDATGKTPDGKDPAELPFGPDVLKAAFAQNNGETSPIMDDKKGDYFIVRTDQITPSAVKPFDKVKDEVADAWRQREEAKRAAAESEDIAKAMRDGKPAASFAASGIEVRTSKPVSLVGDKDAALPSPVLPQIFKMKKGDVITSAQPGEQLVLRLADIVDDPQKDEEGHDRIRGDLTEHTPPELSEQYIKYLRTIYPVEINRDVLDNMVPQEGG